MSRAVQILLVIIAFSFSMAPAMAKETSTSSKAKSTKIEKSKKTTKGKKSTSSKSTSTRKKSAGKNSRSSKSAKKSSSKKRTKSHQTGTSKAKQFKNVTVNINRADAATLSHYLVGIGEVRANDIVKYRKKHGSFKNLEELKQVPGIGDAIFDGVRKNVSLNRGEAKAPKTPAKK